MNDALGSRGNTDDDLWLEELRSEASLEWVKRHSRATEQRFAQGDRYHRTRSRLAEALERPDRIPHVSRIGDQLYNFWTSIEKPRGTWRRTSIASYLEGAPEWEIVLDVDQLARAEQRPWVWAGSNVRASRDELGKPRWRRCLIELSEAGSDAVVIREFDLHERRFLTPEEHPFELPLAKSYVSWLDDDTVYVGTECGPGSLTNAGYPRTIRKWRRDTPLLEAPIVHEGEVADHSVWVGVFETPGHEGVVFGRSLDMTRTKMWLERRGQLRVEIPKREDDGLGFHGRWAVLELAEEFETSGEIFAAGSVLIADTEALLRGKAKWEPVFRASETRSLAGIVWTGERAVLCVLENVACHLEEASGSNGAWKTRAVDFPRNGSIGIAPFGDPAQEDDLYAEHYWVVYSGFLAPDTLLLGRVGTDEFKVVRRGPVNFDGSRHSVTQHFATSLDGTKIPYFVVRRNDLEPNAPTPTLLHVYGGFGAALVPKYYPGFGIGWLEDGGTLVIANLRGGGEFGPSWHEAATGEHKQRSIDDLVAVAEHLVERGFTTASTLGAIASSNGALLIAAAMVQRPAIFGALVCQSPLIDMLRYHQLLAGASWLTEYGDPERPDDREWLARYSPYQNAVADAPYPPVLVTSATSDDRVHPGHARRFVSRLESLGHRPWYHERLEGGHTSGATASALAGIRAIELEFLRSNLIPSREG